MNKEEALTVLPGNWVHLESTHNTSGRKFNFPHEAVSHLSIVNDKVQIQGIKTENGFPHFDIGLKLPQGAEPLKSLDTGEIIDGSNIYWLHPSRFKLG